MMFPHMIDVPTRQAEDCDEDKARYYGQQAEDEKYGIFGIYIPSTGTAKEGSEVYACNDAKGNYKNLRIREICNSNHLAVNSLKERWYFCTSDVSDPHHPCRHRY